MEFIVQLAMFWWAAKSFHSRTGDLVGIGRETRIKTSYASDEEPSVHTWSQVWELRKVCPFFQATAYIYCIATVIIGKCINDPNKSPCDWSRETGSQTEPNG